jgi:hypothetical protein
MKHHHHHHGHHPLHHHNGVGRFLEALRLLVSEGLIDSIEDLVSYAERGGRHKEAEFFRSLLGEPVPVHLALDELSVQIEKEAYRRDATLLSDCKARRVGLICPLPPHIFDQFLPLGAVTFLIPDGHHLPPHLRHLNRSAKQGDRECRKAVSELDVLVFEAYGEEDDLYVAPEVADIVDGRILREDVRIIIHMRPHAHVEDVRLEGLHHKVTIL